MSHAHFQERFPRWVLLTAAALIGFSMLAALVSRLEREERWARADELPVASRALQFFDRDDGSVRVVDAGSGTEVALIASGDGAFIRATLRGLARARRPSGAGAETPFRLSYFADGHLVLWDPVTQRAIDFGAFGQTNARAFARLLAAPEQSDQRAAAGAPS